MSTQGITEDDIAQFLLHTPGFFERHAEVLASVQLASPHGTRAVSLQERQIQLLRDKIRALELRQVEMLRHGQENVAIAERLHRWTRSMMLTSNAGDLPGVLVERLRHEFLIPQAAIRVWGAAEAFRSLAFAQAVSDDVQRLADSLGVPYCGAVIHDSPGFEAAQWFDEPASIVSMAMVPLRLHAEPGAFGEGLTKAAFGLLVLGSPDPTRYTADMGTEFLARIGEIASAGLARLLPVE
ncbi:MAG TPA: DUF484 family protein [Methylibium sp.]|uniref:DUF484 family protein n=1 Tax=Methylibium sp. TaxID=2067992 RepID=UPI002DB92B0A|nr:DUF484 family protein [Methylibium sp.]HEU4457896.1 DUF484 family protein [Methylibium sp.]